MADDDFCQCVGAKTKGIIKKNNNKCPQTNCGKRMTDIQGYESDTEDSTKSDKSMKILTEWLDGLAAGNLKGTKTKDQNQSSVRIKPPTFRGSEDPAHFFIKLSNFIDLNKISKEKDKCAVLKSCLSDEALDLFLSLTEEEQTDMLALERIFKQYFKPVGHDVVETERFLKTKKGKEQSISTYYAQVRKKGKELNIDPAIVRQAFCQGLDTNTLKHCALKEAVTIEDYHKAALQFEQIAQIGKERKESGQESRSNNNCNSKYDNNNNFKSNNNSNNNNNLNNSYNNRNKNYSDNRDNQNSNPNFRNINNRQINDNKQCFGCGGPHHGLGRGSRQAYCSAWGKICNNCGLTNHISRAFFTEQNIQKPAVQQGGQATAQYEQ